MYGFFKKLFDTKVINFMSNASTFDPTNVLFVDSSIFHSFSYPNYTQDRNKLNELGISHESVNSGFYRYGLVNLLATVGNLVVVKRTYSSDTVWKDILPKISSVLNTCYFEIWEDVSLDDLTIQINSYINELLQVFNPHEIRYLYVDSTYFIANKDMVDRHRSKGILAAGMVIPRVPGLSSADVQFMLDFGNITELDLEIAKSVTSPPPTLSFST